MKLPQPKIQKEEEKANFGQNEESSKESKKGSGKEEIEMLVNPPVVKARVKNAGTGMVNMKNMIKGAFSRKR